MPPKFQYTIFRSDEDNAAFNEALAYALGWLQNYPELKEYIQNREELDYTFYKGLPSKLNAQFNALEKGLRKDLNYEQLENGSTFHLFIIALAANLNKDD